MKIKKILLSVLLSVAAIQAFPQVSDSDAAYRTAKSQLQGFVKDIPDANLKDYGFLSRKETESVSFGKPIPVYTLKDSVVVFTSTWRVPVIISKEYRSLLTVVKENGVFKAIDFGATELAKAYQANKTAKTSGMLRVYEIRKDYLIEGPENGERMFIPIEFNR